MSNNQRVVKQQGSLWDRFVRYLGDDFLLTVNGFGLEEQDSILAGEYNLVQLTEKARQEWEQSKMLFNEAAEPDLIDHAIYAMTAAERKYIYLIKEARKERIVDEVLYNVREDREHELA